MTGTYGRRVMHENAAPVVRRPRAAVVLILSSLCMVVGACADAQAKHHQTAPAVATTTSAEPVTTSDPPGTIAVHPSTSRPPAAPDTSTTVADSPNVYAATG